MDLVWFSCFSLNQLTQSYLEDLVWFSCFSLNQLTQSYLEGLVWFSCFSLNQLLQSYRYLANKSNSADKTHPESGGNHSIELNWNRTRNRTCICLISSLRSTQLTSLLYWIINWVCWVKGTFIISGLVISFLLLINLI